MADPVAPPGRGSLVAPDRRTLASLVPVLAWLRTYRPRSALRGDVIAGLTLAALLIPESLGYAGVAGVPPEAGLYAALAAVVAYAIFGGTSVLVVGPASAVAALSASLVAEFGGGTSVVALSAGFAVVAGVLLLLAGALRLGWIVNFISRPVLHAFVAGLSISIIIGQLDGLVGAEVEGESPLARLIDLVASAADWSGTTTAIGLAAVAVLLVLRRFGERMPAAVVVVVAGIVAAAALDLDARGVALVGEIPGGLPELGAPDLGGVRWYELVGAGLALLLVGFSEGYAAASAVADETGEEIDADQELIGSGAANVASGFVGGFAVGGSLSKSAASVSAGARSQVANLVAGSIVLATLLFLAPVFELLPEPVLAAVVIVAVLPSADPRRIIAAREVNKLDFLAAAATFVLVLTWETLPALGVGVALSLAFVIRRVSFPDVVELQRDDEGRFWAVPAPGIATAPLPSVVVMRFEAPLLYANADRLVLAARRLVRSRADVAHLVLDASMLAEVDGTGAELLELLDEDLAGRGVELHLARVHRRARLQLDRSRLAARFEGRVHESLRAAVDAAQAGGPSLGAAGRPDS